MFWPHCLKITDILETSGFSLPLNTSSSGQIHLWLMTFNLNSPARDFWFELWLLFLERTIDFVLTFQHCSLRLDHSFLFDLWRILSYNGLLVLHWPLTTSHLDRTVVLIFEHYSIEFGCCFDLWTFLSWKVLLFWPLNTALLNIATVLTFEHYSLEKGCLFWTLNNTLLNRAVVLTFEQYFLE